MTPISNYKRFITEFVRRHMVILGPNIARDTALGVTGLTIDSTGDATDITGSPPLVMQELINAYMDLSAPVTQLALYSLLDQYPEVKAEYNQPLEKIHLVCSLADGGKI